MICALLLFLGRCESAEEALKEFSDRRTDRSLANKCQGVETPSQARYVQYFAQWLDQNVAISQRPPQSIPLRLVNRQLHLQHLRLVALIGVGQGNGSDLTCRLEVDRREQFSMDFGAPVNCEALYHGEQDAMLVQPINCPSLEGDVRLLFYSNSRKVPKGYEKCAFYFWFNTNFLPSERKPSLRLTREQLDNPHKSATWNVYRERFAVELSFKEVDPNTV